MVDLPCLELTEFGEADLLYQAYKGWRLDTVQTEPGQTITVCRNLLFDDLVVMRDLESHASVNDYLIPPNTTVFAIFRAGTPAVFWCGLEVSDQVVLINPSGRDYFVAIAGGYDAITIVVSNSLIAELELLPETLMSPGEISKRWLVPLTEDGERFRRWLFSLFDSVNALRHLTRDPLAANLFRDRFLSELGIILWGGLGTRTPASATRRSRRCGLARRAYDMIEDRLQEIVSATDLARDLGVSPQVLGNAFRDVFQMSPYQYVLKRKLKAVRCELRDQSASASSVSHVALEYGFRELGRFSQYYRQMFGEMPSATRGRPTVRLEG